MNEKRERVFSWKAVTKKYYRVSLSAEGWSDGYMLLTQEEAELIRKATNCNNWILPELDSWSGSFFIDTEHPMSEEEMKVDHEKRHGWPDQE